MRKVSTVLAAGLIAVVGALGSVMPAQAAGPRVPAAVTDNHAGPAVEQVRHRRDRHWRHGKRHHYSHRRHYRHYGYYPRYRTYGYSPYYYRSRPGFAIRFGFGGHHW